MGARVLRVGERVAHIGIGGVQVAQPLSAGVDWWDPDGEGLSVIAAYRAKGAASYAASKVNLANPGTYDLTENNGIVSWTQADGWEFTAAQVKSFDTGIVPSSGYSALSEFDGMPAGASVVLWGAFEAVGGKRFYMYPRNLAARAVYAAGGALLVGNGLTYGNYGIAGQEGFRNGASDGVIGAGPFPTISMYLGAFNYDGLADSHITANLHAFVLYGATLTPAQMAAVDAEMGAL